jgi:hypothetical protein
MLNFEFKNINNFYNLLNYNSYLSKWKEDLFDHGTDLRFVLRLNGRFHHSAFNKHHFTSDVENQFIVFCFKLI